MPDTRQFQPSEILSAQLYQASPTGQLAYCAAIPGSGWVQQSDAGFVFGRATASGGGQYDILPGSIVVEGTGLAYAANHRPLSGIVTSIEISLGGDIDNGTVTTAPVLRITGLSLDVAGPGQEIYKLLTGDIFPLLNYFDSLPWTYGGSEGPDWFQGGSLADTISGNGGRDLLMGAGDADELNGGAGDDSLFGGAGDDVLSGDDGDDELIGDVGADQLRGGAGSDTVSYAYDLGPVTASLANPSDNKGIAAGDTYDSIENLVGSSGNDHLYGDGGANRLEGGAGDDYLSGNGGNDELLGGEGTDQLFGGAGNDILNGGKGADLLVGSAGNDFASYANAASVVNVSLLNPGVFNGEAAGDVYDSIESLIGSRYGDTLEGDNGANTLRGRDGNDTIRSHGGADLLAGDAGDDLLIGGAGADKLQGGVGYDTASYAEATAGIIASLADPLMNQGEALGDTFSSIEQLGGSAFRDYLYGDKNANALVAGAGDDDLIGFEGADRLFGDGGNDELYGGEGDDTLAGGAGADYLSGGLGRDWADYRGATDTVFASLANSSINKGDAAGDTYNSVENLAGSNQGDVLNGSNLANDILGLDGDDTIKGYGGDDRLEGGAGDDILIGGAGADKLVGGDLGPDAASYFGATSGVVASLADSSINTGDAAGDTYEGIEGLTGSDFDDYLYAGGAYTYAMNGGAGNDVLTGYAYADNLFGNSGDDTLNGLDGDDILAGGTGIDHLFGGEGLDAASYSDAATGVIASLANPSINTGDAVSDIYDSIEGLIGSAFKDALNGDNDINRILGGAGNDTIKGYGGNDDIWGDEGDDLLIGGGGEDKLVGGDGTDTASYANAVTGVIASLADWMINTGEAYRDRYYFVENLVGSSFHDALHGDDRANVINGGAGNDILEGGRGNDTLTGGAGDDIFLFNTSLSGPSSNVDRIVDYEATDKIHLDNAVFTALATGNLAASAFKDLATGVLDADDRIVYNSATGVLYYDRDGSGSAAQSVKFAIIGTLPILTAADFAVI